MNNANQYVYIIHNYELNVTIDKLGSENVSID